MPDAWSYGVAAFTFAVFAAQLIVSRRENWRAVLLLAAVALSAGWAASAAVYSVAPSQLWWLSAHALDTLRQGSAIAFLMVLTHRAAAEDLSDTGRRRAAQLRFALLGAFTLLTLLAAVPPEISSFGVAGTSVAFSLLLMRSIVGLVAVEQLFRRTQPGWRWNVRPLCLGFAAVFLYDLVLFADALLYRGMDENLWTGRGIVNALVIPLLGIAATRNREWRLAVGVSRTLLAGSTALFASGLYLLGIAGIGYYLRYFGGSWGGALQIVLVFAGALLLGLVLLSGTFRSKLRVLVSKHFFAYRYDYREEWLKITRALSEATASSTPQLCVRALADLVESPSGALWLKRAGEGFVPVAHMNMSHAIQVEPADGHLSQFLGPSGWVIDLDELRDNPARYPGFIAPNWLALIPDAWLVIPLPNGDELVGFVVLAHPRVRVELNWEVLDLLKTAGRQVASYLAMSEANDALLEARKFDAFNRMSAFVVHDLKNLVAQLQLLLRNAERHRENPDFQRDMLSTVEHAVARMSHLMAQLRAGVTPLEYPQSIDLATIARQVQRARSNSEGVELELDLGVYVLGHQDRLERVVGHLVQNSFDAVGDNPRVRIRVFRDDSNGVVEVEDNGVGMSSEFVRERLFRPFQSTKEMGMGIGAYESMQYVTALGGRISVDSRPGQGTIVRVSLPLAVEPQAKRVQEEAA